MGTPSHASISPMRRASVQLRRSATGASSNGAATLRAASALIGAGSGAGLLSSALTPPRAKSLRHRRTILANAECFGNARARPTRKRQQQCARRWLAR